MATKRHREVARRGASVPRHSRTIPNGKEGPNNKSDNSPEGLFTIGQIVTNLQEVDRIIENSINAIIDEALERMDEVGPANVPEISNCNEIQQ